MTLATIIETLKMIALKHPNVNSAYEGNIYEILNANPNNKYASVVITQQSHTTDEVYDHYGFVIFYVDRLVDDMEENRVQIQSCGKSMLGNIITFFCEEFEAECDNITYQPFTQKFVDMTCGVYCTITIDTVKDVYCPEEYWKEDWVTPVTVIRNQDKRVTFTENGTYTIDYDPTTYTGLGNVEVEVNIDVDSYYNNGYNQGKTDGVSEQKSKLESINITENGTYTKEDGYNEVVVNVPDLNGDYNEGYEQGHTEGYNEGYAEGEGIGYNQGQADLAAKARVLNVTENGVYQSKYSDKTLLTEPTGVYENGDLFFDYAYLKNIQYNTNIYPMSNTKMEIWWKYDGSKEENEGCIIGCQNWGYANSIFKIGWSLVDNRLLASINDDTIFIPFIEGWNHIVMSYADGLWLNSAKIGNFPSNITDDMANKEPICINGYYGNNRMNSDYFGMVKINDVVFIPTENGFLNTSTNELLPIHREGEYTYTSVVPKYDEPTGELYKTINVDVIPKINPQKEGLRLGYSTFTEVPEWVDFNGVTDMARMFSDCTNLQAIPEIDTSGVTNMERMFYNCGIQTIPLLDTSKVSNANGMFYWCSKLKTLPNNFNFGKCTNLSDMFNNAGLTDYSFLETWVINPNASMDNMITNTNTTYVPAIPCVGNTSYYQSAIFWTYGDYSKLTYFGGWIGRKYNVDRDQILKKMPNLTYESCISILNNLYDFTGNGETPDNSQGKLKVAQSFIDKVGDEISIGTNKGWTITV